MKTRFFNLLIVLTVSLAASFDGKAQCPLVPVSDTISTAICEGDSGRAEWY